MQVGDKLTLACISRGGNPPARLIWLRNDEQVDVTYSTGGREATNTHTFTVGPKDNKAVYKCEASNTVTLQPLSASVRLNVLCKLKVFKHYIPCIDLTREPTSKK